MSFSAHDKSLLMETGELWRRSLSYSSRSIFPARESFSQCLLLSPSLDAKALHRQPLYYTEYTLIRSLIERFPLMGSRRRVFLGRAWCNTYMELSFLHQSSSWPQKSAGFSRCSLAKAHCKHAWLFPFTPDFFPEPTNSAPGEAILEK